MRFASVDQCIQPTTISLSPLTLASQGAGPRSPVDCHRGSSASKTRRLHRRPTLPSTGFPRWSSHASLRTSSHSKAGASSPAIVNDAANQRSPRRLLMRSVVETTVPSTKTPVKPHRCYLLAIRNPTKPRRRMHSSRSMRGAFAILMRDESHAFDPQRDRTKRPNTFLSFITVSSPRGSQRRPADNREYAMAGHCSAPAVAASRENPPFLASSSTKRFYRSRRPPSSLYTHSRGCSRAIRNPMFDQLDFRPHCAGVASLLTVTASAGMRPSRQALPRRHALIEDLAQHAGRPILPAGRASNAPWC